MSCEMWAIPLWLVAAHGVAGLGMCAGGMVRGLNRAAHWIREHGLAADAIASTSCLQVTSLQWGEMQAVVRSLGIDVDKVAQGQRGLRLGRLNAEVSLLQVDKTYHLID